MPFKADHSVNNFSGACFLFRLCMVHILAFGCIIQMRSKRKYVLVDRRNQAQLNLMI